MALRSSGSDLPLIIRAILLGVIVLAAKRVADSAVPAIFVIGLLAAVLGAAFTYSQAKARRVGRLRAKYGDDGVVERILGRKFWEGQTADQLRDALGQPDSIEDQMIISRSRQAWVYGRRRIMITLDDGVVVAWNKRS
jgi:hypothetical protein